MLAGSEAYAAALVFYRAVRNAKVTNYPGSDTIYADLSERFPGRSTMRTTSSPESDNTSSPGSNNTGLPPEELSIEA